MKPEDNNESQHHVPGQSHYEDDQVGHGHHHLGTGQEDYGLVVRSTTKTKVYICNKQTYFLSIPFFKRRKDCNFEMENLKGGFWKCRAVSTDTASNFFGGQKWFYIFWHKFRHLF